MIHCDGIIIPIPISIIVIGAMLHVLAEYYHISLIVGYGPCTWRWKPYVNDKCCFQGRTSWLGGGAAPHQTEEAHCVWRQPPGIGTSSVLPSLQGANSSREHQSAQPPWWCEIHIQLQGIINTSTSMPRHVYIQHNQYPTNIPVLLAPDVQWFTAVMKLTESLTVYYFRMDTKESGWVHHTMVERLLYNSCSK